MMKFKLNSRLVLSAFIIGVISLPSRVVVQPVRVPLAQLTPDELQGPLSKYFRKDANGKLSFVMPAPILKAMHAEAATESCSDSSSATSSSGSTSSSSSDSDSSSDLNACDTKWQDYQSQALGFYHNALCRLNNGYTASAQRVLCSFAKVLNVDASFSSLPIDAKDSFDLGVASYTLELKADVPTEDFATDAGYTVKATLSVNDQKYLVIYWNGSSDASKGFLIESGSGFRDQQASYIQWDLTDSDDQKVRVFAANMHSGQFMKPLQSGYHGSDRNFDTVLYGSVSYDNSSKSVGLQYVELRPQRRRFGNDVGCFKVIANGTAGESVQIARSSSIANGGAVADSHINSNGLVGVSLIDDPATRDSSAVPLTSDQLDAFADFDKSCADLKAANRNSGAFANNSVNFSAAPDDVF